MKKNNPLIKPFDAIDVKVVANIVLFHIHKKNNMKNIVLYSSLFIVSIGFSQETSTTAKPLEFKIHERKHEAISRVNNNQVCERRILKEDRHERNQNGLNKERHQRPHFDKANRRENSKRNTERKERSNREPRTKEQRSENRNNRIERRINR